MAATELGWINPGVLGTPTALPLINAGTERVSRYWNSRRSSEDAVEMDEPGYRGEDKCARLRFHEVWAWQ